MRPVRRTPAHRTGQLAELVCSNSLKSDQHPSASWLLKEELRRFDSLLLRLADRARVPGGHALTVDREVFAAEITRAIESEPLIEVRREEVERISDHDITIIATGPLTSDALATELARLTGSPVVELNRAVAIAMADGPDAGLSIVAALEQSGELAGYHLLAATKADLLRRLNRREEAAAAYREALPLATADSERRYLARRLVEITGPRV